MIEKTSIYSDLPHRYNDLQKEIISLNPAPGDANHRVRLLAVVKNQPVEKIDILLKAGHHYFAENRVQEAISHWQERKPAWPQTELHLIGPLQRNKVREAVNLFDVIETLDSEKLLLAIASEALRQDKVQRCMIQVNIGREPQKSGIMVEALPALLDISRCYPSLQVEGLMCIPPVDTPPAPYFVAMKELQQQYNLPYLSMGMSGDYREAIIHGATHIRIGTALLGERQ